MTTVTASWLPVWRFTDNSGNSLVGGQLFTYIAGTSTPQATYTDSTGGTPLPNPIILNARGETSITSGASCGVWMPLGLTYKLVLQDAVGNQIWAIDNFRPGNKIDVAFYIEGKPGASEALFNIIFPRTYVFPAAFSGSVAVAAIASTGTAVFNIGKNGSNIGTMTFIASSVGVFALASVTTFNANDVLNIVGPSSQDATLSGVSFTLEAVGSA